MKKKDTLFCLVEKYDNHFDQSICLELLIPDISQYSFQTNILNSSSWTPLDGAFNVICEIFSCQKSKGVFVALCKNILRIFHLAKKISGQESAFHKAQYWNHLVERLEDGQWSRPSFLLGSPQKSPIPSTTPHPVHMSLVTNIEGFGQECDGMCSRHHHPHCHPPACEHTLLP